jgi:predicted O-methyltransferase YrrM
MDLVPNAIKAVMVELKTRDITDRSDGTAHAAQLRAVSPEVGQLLLTLALSIKASKIVEIGTSGGYSTLWLAVAAARTGGRVVTFEIDPAKVARARRSFEAAGVDRVVELRESDGGAGLAEQHGSADLVFLDSEKFDYVRLLELAIGALRPGGLLVADNLISHESELVEFRAHALADPRLSGLVIPIGAGELVAVRL